MLQFKPKGASSLDLYKSLPISRLARNHVLLLISTSGCRGFHDHFGRLIVCRT